jgi:hypothetical protein
VLLVLVLIATLSPADDRSDRDNAAGTTERRADGGTDTSGQVAEARAARAEADRRRATAARREEAQARARRARARRARAARRREAALAAEQERLAEDRERQEQQEEQQQREQCHPDYDPCLDPNASDYDCENGSGDGPEYTGLVTVKRGSDPYDLDRDGDGTGCDP